MVVKTYRTFTEEPKQIFLRDIKRSSSMNLNGNRKVSIGSNDYIILERKTSYQQTASSAGYSDGDESPDVTILREIIYNKHFETKSFSFQKKSLRNELNLNDKIDGKRNYKSFDRRHSHSGRYLENNCDLILSDKPRKSSLRTSLQSKSCSERRKSYSYRKMSFGQANYFIEKEKCLSSSSSSLSSTSDEVFQNEIGADLPLWMQKAQEQERRWQPAQEDCNEKRPAEITSQLSEKEHSDQTQWEIDKQEKIFYNTPSKLPENENVVMGTTREGPKE